MLAPRLAHRELRLERQGDCWRDRGRHPGRRRRTVANRRDRATLANDGGHHRTTGFTCSGAVVHGQFGVADRDSQPVGDRGEVAGVAQ